MSNQHRGRGFCQDPLAGAPIIPDVQCPIILDTIADLRAYAFSYATFPDGQVAFVKGYYEIGDGGGGWFNFSRSSEADDNGGTIIQPTDNSGRWERFFTQSVSASWFGAVAERTAVQNKAALQSAISAGTAGQVIVVPAGVDYGLVYNDITTYPDFTDIEVDLLVLDYGIADADGSGNKAGQQVRKFFYTVQTTPPGEHDGNADITLGDWHPNFGVNNTADYAAPSAPSRTAYDNRRASYFIYNKGVATWRIGQGTVEGADYTDEELSNFVIEAFGTSIGAYAPVLIERETGRMAFGLGTNAPTAGFQFRPVIAPAGSGFVTDIQSHEDDADCRVAQTNTQFTKSISWRLAELTYTLFAETVGAVLAVTLAIRQLAFTMPPKLPSFTVGTLPDATVYTGGSMIYVTDETGGAVPAFSDGTNWRRVTDRNIIS